jgi:small-conductance mechanosensitive channel
MPIWQWIVQLRQQQDGNGNTVDRWLLALALFCGVALLLRVIKSVVERRMRGLAERSTPRWPTVVLELAERTRSIVLMLLAAFCGLATLKLPPDFDRVLQSAAILVLLLQAAIWGNALLNFTVLHYSKNRLASDASSATTVAVLGFLGKLTLWVLVVLVALDNAGVNVTALVTGLGIGGIAVALAAQNILGDLFASISIMLDKPFVLGDSIAVGDFNGTVEHIGIKTTRLRSVSGEQVIFANNDLLQSRVRNYKRMTERRMIFTIGVTYQTPKEKLAWISQMLKDVVESQSPVRFDRAHLKMFGDSAIQFEIVYFVLNADNNISMDIQQAINLAICERFEQNKIEFAYPTRKVYLETAKDGAG